MSISDDISLGNKQIEINTINDKSASNMSTEKRLNSNPAKNAYKGLLKNIKGLIRFGNSSPENTQSNTLSENNQVEISSSQQENNIVNDDTCRGKMAKVIINKVEVEKNYTIFFALIGLGLLLLCLSIFMLPFILTSPSKFSLCFSFGSMLVLISFLFLFGTKVYVSKLFSENRFWITILFIVSILVGIIFSLGKHYFISFLCSLFQLFSLVMFMLTFVPGGRKGINSIKKTISSPFVKVFMRLASSEVNQWKKNKFNNINSKNN